LPGGGIRNPGFSRLSRIIKIFLLPDGDDLNDENIVMYEKSCPVLTDSEPVSRIFPGAVFYLDNIMPQIRLFGKRFEGELMRIRCSWGNASRSFFARREKSIWYTKTITISGT